MVLNKQLTNPTFLFAQINEYHQYNKRVAYHKQSTKTLEYSQSSKSIIIYCL